jgi:hypothetical protein
MYIFILLIAALAILNLQDARAEETMCNSSFWFRWGQEVSGTLDAKSGTPCRILTAVSGNTVYVGSQVVTQPRHGRASPLGPASIRYQPRAGFVGQDTMTIRFLGERQGQRNQATVRLKITVY